MNPGNRIKNFIKLTGTTMLLILSATYCNNMATAEEASDALYQASVLQSLMEGMYEGELTIGELREHGDFGVGTYNKLNGEMVVLDGVFYQVKSDGTIVIAEDSAKTPFAIVTFFDTNQTMTPDKGQNCQELMKSIEKALPDKDIFYAIKVSGTFEHMKTRSVPEQQAPYPPLSEVIKIQSEFQLNDVSGTIVGLWMPEYMGKLNQPGFHFHFISDDRKSGGHVLDCRADNINVEIDYMRELDLEVAESEGQ